MGSVSFHLDSNGYISFSQLPAQGQMTEYKHHPQSEWDLPHLLRAEVNYLKVHCYDDLSDRPAIPLEMTAIWVGGILKICHF